MSSDDEQGSVTTLRQVQDALDTGSELKQLTTTGSLLNSLKFVDNMDQDGYFTVVEDGRYYLGRLTPEKGTISFILRPLHEEFTNGDISLVMYTAACSRDKAIDALQKNDGDIVGASQYLS